MALTIYARENGETALACTGTLRLDNFNEPFHDLTNASVKRFDDLLVVISGPGKEIDYAYSTIDLDALSKAQLTLKNVYSLFVQPYITQFYEEGENKDYMNDDKTITTFPIDALFVKGDKAIMFKGNNLKYASDYETFDIDSTFADSLWTILYGKHDANFVAVEAIRASINRLTIITYPIFLVNPKSMTVTIIEKDGSTSVQELPNCLSGQPVLATDSKRATKALRSN